MIYILCINILHHLVSQRSQLVLVEIMLNKEKITYKLSFLQK